MINYYTLVWRVVILNNLSPTEDMLGSEHTRWFFWAFLHRDDALLYIVVCLTRETSLCSVYLAREEDETQGSMVYVQGERWCW